MRRFLLQSLFIFIAGAALAQSSCTARFWPEKTFSVNRYADISFGLALNYQGQMQELKMNVFVPEDADTAPRPLMVWLYGGGFFGGDKRFVEWPANDFATRGFVTAAPDYRLGWDLHTDAICESDGQTMYPAMHRAIQDVRAAIRYLVHFADSFHIDTANVFIGGYSAGAILSFHVPYQQDTETDSLLADSLGALDQAVNSYAEPVNVKALVSYAGALSDADMMRSGEKIPFLAFHGTCDDIVYYGHGPIFSCPALPALDGPEILSVIADSAGICHELRAWCGGTHNLGPYEIASRDVAFRFLLDNVVCGNCNSPGVIPVFDQAAGDCSRIPLCQFNADSLPFRFSVSPNPSTGIFQLIPDTDRDHLVSISLVGMQGEYLLKQDYLLSEKEQALSLSLEGFATGLYLLRIRSNTGLTFYTRIEIFR